MLDIEKEVEIISNFDKQSYMAKLGLNSALVELKNCSLIVGASSSLQVYDLENLKPIKTIEHLYGGLNCGINTDSNTAYLGFS